MIIFFFRLIFNIKHLFFPHFILSFYFFYMVIRRCAKTIRNQTLRWKNRMPSRQFAVRCRHLRLTTAFICQTVDSDVTDKWNFPVSVSTSDKLRLPRLRMEKRLWSNLKRSDSLLIATELVTWKLIKHSHHKGS